MTLTSDSTPRGLATDRHSALVGTLPLITLTGALIAGAYLSFLASPKLGQGNYPLWGLLLTLGFVAAIGSVVSWFFATDDDEPSVRPKERARGDDSPTPRTPRNELGRPAPDLTARPSSQSPPGGAVPAVAAAKPKVADPWNEDVLPPIPSKGPRPVLTTLEDPGDIGRALEEIAEIQRQLAVRPPTASAAREASARS